MDEELDIANPAGDAGALAAAIAGLFGKLTLKNMAELGAAMISADVDEVELLGYHESGIGRGRWRRAAAEPVHAAKSQSADGAWWRYLPVDQVANIRAVGARCDAREVDAAINATEDIITSAFANFTAADVGREVHIDGARLGWQDVHFSTITEIISATQARIADAATKTVAGVRCLVATNDTTALEAAISLAFWEPEEVEKVRIPGHCLIGKDPNEHIFVQGGVAIEGARRDTKVWISSQHQWAYGAGTQSVNAVFRFFDTSAQSGLTIRRMTLDGYYRKAANWLQNPDTGAAITDPDQDYLTSAYTHPLVTVGDASISATSKTLTLTGGGTFAADVAGARITVPGAGSAGEELYTVIETRDGSTTVTLRDAAVTTVSGATISYGFGQLRFNGNILDADPADLLDTGDPLYDANSVFARKRRNPYYKGNLNLIQLQNMQSFTFEDAIVLNWRGRVLSLVKCDDLVVQRCRFERCGKHGSAYQVIALFNSISRPGTSPMGRSASASPTTSGARSRPASRHPSLLTPASSGFGTTRIRAALTMLSSRATVSSTIEIHRSNPVASSRFFALATSRPIRSTTSSSSTTTFLAPRVSSMSGSSTRHRNTSTPRRSMFVSRMAVASFRHLASWNSTAISQSTERWRRDRSGPRPTSRHS